MKEKLVSIIMPAYNAENYLTESIGSVQAQTYPNWELLVVDDGSEDGSRALVQSIAQKDPRVKLLCNQHGGTARARNAALDVAKGDYVAFIDADDAYHPQFLEMQMTAAAQNDAELVMCGFRKGTEVQEFLTQPLDQGQELVDVHTVFVRMYTGQWSSVISPCTKLYDRKLFRQVRFPVGQYFEDTSTTNLAINGAQRICILDAALYFYRVTPGSASKTNRSVELLDREKALRSHWELHLAQGKMDLAYLAMGFYLYEMMITSYRIRHSDKPEDDKILRKHFIRTYRKYRSKLDLDSQKADMFDSFAWPRRTLLKKQIRQEGAVKAVVGILKRKLGKK